MNLRNRLFTVLRWKLTWVFYGLSAIAVLLGTWSHQARAQRRAVAAIRTLHGAVTYTDGPLACDWSRTYLGEDFVSNVTGVRLPALRDPDIAISNVAHFRHLRSLQLTGSALNDEALSRIKHLTHLEVLFLDSTRITDSGLSTLQNFPRVRKLFLNDTDVSNVGLHHLKALKSLAVLDLQGTRITDAGLADLASMTQLKSVFLATRGVSEAGVRAFKVALPTCRVPDHP